ncbi:MAG TPA: ROK family protein [Bryobacteraceae bacterium]|nr:ROK family protein [Bryobacteraceae bacterium]
MTASGNTSYSIGLDHGGTNLRAAAVSRDGKMLDKVSGRTQYSEGREAILGDMVEAIETLRQRFGVENLAGIGIGVPGFISLQEGIIRNCNNITALENFPIREEIGRRLGTKIILENDANAAALGEKWIGAGRHVDDLVMLTLGTGVGGGIISNGRVLRGIYGMAAELGHITVVPNGNPCGCGNRGCVEKHASATAITAQARMLGLGGDQVTARDVYDLAKAGNPKAQMIFAGMGEALGVVLAMLINSFNFPLYLLAGGMIAGWDAFAPAMLEETRRRSFTFRTTVTTIEKAELGNEAGLYGAAYLPWCEN